MVIKTRKAVSSDLVLVGGFVLVIVVGVAVILQIVNLSSSQGGASRLQQAIMEADLAIQGVKQTFEKSAIFFGLMNATKELGLHGGVREWTTKFAASTLTPKMDVGDGIAYWAVERCNNTAGLPNSVVRKRTPFVLNEDYNISVKIAPTSALLVDGVKYSQNLKEVMNGVAAGYSFYTTIQVFMLKEGTVTVKVCHPSRCATDFIEQTTSTSGMMFFAFWDNVVKKSDEDVDIYIRGDKDNVAIVRQVAVSIYDANVVADPDTLITERLNSYWAKAVAIGAKVKVTPFEASFVPAGQGVYKTLNPTEGFSKGISWAPNKAVATYSAVDASAEAKAWGTSEDDVQIRYWKMQELAEWFTHNYEAWVKPRWYNRLNNDFQDHAVVSDAFCGQPSYLIGCPANPIPSYTSGMFRAAMNDELDRIASSLNALYAPEDIAWTITVPSSLFDGCDTVQSALPSALNWCNKPNMEYYEYKNSWVDFLGCTSDCYYVPDGCNGGGDGCKNKNRCTIHYDERYILKNVPISVTLTDTKYNLFDVASKSWKPYTFTFLVEMDLVDDNACGSYDHICSASVGPPPAPMVVPPVTGGPETCLAVPMQTCELGASCPAPKVAGVGTCNAGSVCCTPALPNTCASLGGTCTTAVTCPVATPLEISKALISDCTDSTKLCCKPTTEVDKYVDLTYSVTYGLPVTPWEATFTCGVLIEVGTFKSFAQDNLAIPANKAAPAAGTWNLTFMFTAAQMQALKDAGCNPSTIVLGGRVNTGVSTFTNKNYLCTYSNIWNGVPRVGLACTPTGLPDTTPPAAITDLAAINPTATTIKLTWTAPGDDGNTGTAKAYDIRYSTLPINPITWITATVVTGVSSPSAAGTPSYITVKSLSSATLYYFAIDTVDAAGNWAGLSNVASATTT